MRLSNSLSTTARNYLQGKLTDLTNIIVTKRLEVYKYVKKPIAVICDITQCFVTIVIKNVMWAFIRNISNRC